jgi:hypothetical protein
MGKFDEVELRDRDTGEWGAGFQLQDATSAGDDTQFQVRRSDDGAVLPQWFSAAEIRPPQTARDAPPLSDEPRKA